MLVFGNNSALVWAGRLDEEVTVYGRADRICVASDDEEDQARSENTVRKILRHCKAVFGDNDGAEGLDLIDRSPFRKISTSVIETDENQRYLTMDELKQVLEAFPDDRWRCLFALCRLAGVLRGDALRLTWADVIWDKSILHIRSKRKKRTTKDSTRLCPIVPELMTILRDAFDRAEEGAVKVCSMYTGRLVTRAREFVASAGVSPYLKPFQTLPCNRRSDWDEQFPAADIDRWMGHDEKVVRKRYHQTKSITWAKGHRQEPADTGPTADEILQALEDPALREQILAQLKEASPQNPPNF